MEEVGLHVQRWKIGDKVWTVVSPSEGALVEIIVVESSRVHACPKTLDEEGAATVPYSGMITLEALIKHGTFKFALTYT